MSANLNAGCYMEIMEGRRTSRTYALEQAQDTLKQSAILVEIAKRLIAHSQVLKGQADELHRRHMMLVRQRDPEDRERLLEL